MQVVRRGGSDHFAGRDLGRFPGLAWSGPGPAVAVACRRILARSLLPAGLAFQGAGLRRPRRSRSRGCAWRSGSGSGVAGGRFRFLVGVNRTARPVDCCAHRPGCQWSPSGWAWRAEVLDHFGGYFSVAIAPRVSDVIVPSDDAPLLEIHKQPILGGKIALVPLHCEEASIRIIHDAAGLWQTMGAPEVI